jgi:hypothetical protein
MGFRASDGQTRGCAEAANRPESIYEIGSSGIAESLDILLDHCEEAPHWKTPSHFGIDAHRKVVLDSDKCKSAMMPLERWIRDAKGRVFREETTHER